MDRVGGPAALARLLEIRVQSIVQWDQVPAARVLDVEKFTGEPRWKLRPDYYPPPSDQSATADHGLTPAPATVPAGGEEAPAEPGGQDK